MAGQEGYLIGPGLRTKLRQTIARVEGMTDGGGGGEIPTRLQHMQRQGGGGNIRVGKTTADWMKDTLATIELYEEGTPPGETSATPTAETLEDCVNHFANVSEGRWVEVAKGANGYWYLIGFEPDTLDVLTGVSLSGSALIFTRKTISVVYADKENATIEVTECPPPE